MPNISIVIITKNEAADIAGCIHSAKAISSDIIVTDTGSSDNTVEIAKENGARVIETSWINYGTARNAGAAQAIHDWVLAIDADERITDSLAKNILTMADVPNNTVIGFKRENYFQKKRIRFGDWGHDVVYRLYNKNYASWQNIPVHENLFGKNISRKQMKGNLLHYTVENMHEYTTKIAQYALLSAYKYMNQKRKATLFKRLLSPGFNFMACYLLRLGFLDGKEGLIIAIYTSYYTHLKYKYLAAMEKDKPQRKRRWTQSYTVH